MASRRQGPDRGGGSAAGGGWIPEPEVSGASGGHLAPEVRPTGPLFDDADDGTPASAARKGRPRAETPAPQDPGATQSMPLTAEPPRTVPARTAARRRFAIRRVKRTLRHVDPVSVLKLSAFFYAVFIALWLILAAILYSIIASMGVFDAIESISRGFALEFEVEIDLWFIERWAFIIGFVIAVIGIVVNTVAAFLYNVAADTIGGVEMTFVERDTG